MGLFDSKLGAQCRRGMITTVMLSLTCVTCQAAAQAEDAATRIILVVGAGGTSEYAEEFDRWVDRWTEVAGKSDAELSVIGREAEADTPDRDRLQKAITSIADGPRAAWIVLIGHGTYSRNVAKFNLRGRDVSATELAEWLQPIGRPVVVVDCASASGPFINRLSGENRVIVTATKSGMEQNYARFGKYFAEALSSLESDLDHDDEVSVHEAFVSASAGVQQFYDSDDRLSTEHALIDDNGDGRGTPAKMFRGTRAIAAAKDGSELDGKRARRITLSPTSRRLPLTAEELRQRHEIEAQLDGLRQKREGIGEPEYFAELEQLMLRMAKIYQAAEKRAANNEAESRDEGPSL